MKRFLSILPLLLLSCDRSKDPARLSGVIEYTEYTLGPRAGGRLEAVSVEEGGRVTKGQIIARLDHLDQARRESDRLSALSARGAASQQAAEEAQLAWKDQQVVSPVDGVVLVLARRGGEACPAGGAVAVVGDDKAPFIRVHAPADLLPRLKEGREVIVRLDGFDGTRPGRIGWVSPQADFTPRDAQTPEERVDRTFAVKILLGPSPDLRPGMGADVDVAP